MSYYVYLCPGEHQHSRQCVPGVGVFEGAPPLPPSELHPSSTGIYIRPATKSMEQPTGLLQVSTLRHLFHLALTFIWYPYFSERELAGSHLHLALKSVRSLLHQLFGEIISVTLVEIT